MKKLLFFNLTLIITLILGTELSLWIIKNIELKKTTPQKSEWISFFQNPFGTEFKFIPKYFPNEEENWGRNPEGLEYKNLPIVLFGCSYTYGLNLKKEQTFSYKLAHIAKRPVYNRAWIGWGIQHMLEQTTFEEVFNTLPIPEYVIYTHIDDHIRRLYISNISTYDFLTKSIYLNYEEKDENLIKKINKNNLKSFLSNTYIARIIKDYKIQKFVKKEEYLNQRINFALKHFNLAKNNINKHWPDTKFIVFFYDDSESNQILKSALEKNGFTTLTSKDLTTEDLKSPKYSYDNHPTEAAWDLLTPLIVERLNLNIKIDKKV